MKGILITGIGGDIAQGVATLVRESRPGVRIVGTDLHAEHGGSLYSDHCLTVPPAGDQSYGSVLRDVIVRHGIDLVMPMTEAEIPVIPAALGDPPLVRYVTPGPGAVAAGIDKLATANMLRGLDLNPPWTIAAADAMPLSYPCILKPRFGSGSRGLLVINNELEARCLANKYPQALFQEWLEPAQGEVTCAVYRTRDGGIGILQLLRRLAGGLTGWATVIRDLSVERMCAKIAESVDLRGSINIQLKLTARGPRIFEINSRFSSTVVMRHRLGFTDVVWTLDELDGRPVRLTRVSPGKTVARVYGAAVLPDRQLKERA